MPFISYSRDQDWLLPPSLGELIPADHPVRFIAEVVDQLPWDEVGISHLPKSEGKPSYPPQMLLAAWLYGFMTRTRSSRKLEQACRENLPMMWLTGLLHPDHSTLSRFYKQNRQAMRPLFKATVQLAVKAGLVEFAFQAVDGTRMGSASLRALHSREEITRLLAAVEAELAAMDATEAQSDGSYEFVGALPCLTSGRHGYTIRILPQDASKRTAYLPGYIIWASYPKSISGLTNRKKSCNISYKVVVKALWGILSPAFFIMHRYSPKAIYIKSDGY